MLPNRDTVIRDVNFGKIQLVLDAEVCNLSDFHRGGTVKVIFLRCELKKCYDDDDD